ncbi:MAG: outer membrane beta-barrel protein [Bacteroidota bacterium]|nr:outer membrane beta-barrel protein [Bacteroidota bacterium]
MKLTYKLPVFLLVFLGQFSLSLAQEGKLGVHFGLNQSNFLGIQSESLETSKLQTATYGLNYEYEFKNKITLYSGINYIQRGFTGINQFENLFGRQGANFNGLNKYEYVGIPMAMGYKYGKKLKLEVLVGLNTSYKIKSNTTIVNYFDPIGAYASTLVKNKFEIFIKISSILSFFIRTIVCKFFQHIGIFY